MPDQKMMTVLHPEDADRFIETLAAYIEMSEADKKSMRESTLGSFLIVASAIWHRVPGRGTVPVFSIPFATIRLARSRSTAIDQASS